MTRAAGVASEVQTQPPVLGGAQGLAGSLAGLGALEEGLEDRVRKSLVRYVDDSYDIIDDPREVERRLIDKCL